MRRKSTTGQRSSVIGGYGQRCVYCGIRLATEGDVRIDHVFPWAKSGNGDTSNLVPACQSCNSKKAAGDPGPWIDKMDLDAKEELLFRMGYGVRAERTKQYKDAIDPLARQLEDIVVAVQRLVPKPKEPEPEPEPKDDLKEYIEDMMRDVVISSTSYRDVEMRWMPHRSEEGPPSKAVSEYDPFGWENMR